MRVIHRRDFEETIKNSPSCAIVCTMIGDSKSKKCLDDVEETLIKKYPNVKFLNYDLTCDVDITELYKIEDVPVILIFKNNNLVNKIVYNSKDMVKKV